jgi:hypothetical protein
MTSQDIYYLLGKQPSRQSFFMGCILDIYQHESGFFGFTCYREAGKLQVFNAQPIYDSEEIALREAKKYHVLTNVLVDTKTITIVCDLTTDRIIGQSKLAIKLLGKIDGVAARELYADERDRDNIRRSLQETECYSTRSRLKAIDKIIETDISIKLIAIDEKTKFSVEQMDVAHHSR